MKHLKVAIKNDRNLSLSAIVEVPDIDNLYPFVLMLHGFKGYKDEGTYTELAKELNNFGIGSIRFDASGFADSEGSIEKDYRFVNYVKDVESVYTWLKSQSYVDRNRIGVFGQSMGGMQTIVFASSHQEIKALCVVSSPEKMATTDLLANELKGWKERGYLEMDSSRYSHKIRFPYEFIKEAMKWDMQDFVPKIKTPSLYIWGTEDKTVNPDRTRMLFNLANEPKKFLEVEGMDHFYKKDIKHLNLVNSKTVDFFKELL